MSAEQLFKAASATSHSELLQALKECDSDAIYTFHARLFDAVIKVNPLILKILPFSKLI